MDMLNAARNELEAITNQGSLLKDAIAEQTSSQKVGGGGLPHSLRSLIAYIHGYCTLMWLTGAAGAVE